VTLHAPADLPLRKESPLSIGEVARWVLEPVWTLLGREKFPVGNRTPVTRTVAIPTELSQDTNIEERTCWIGTLFNMERGEILDLANQFGITGFCLPGTPGIINAEGLRRLIDH
jgi:hypothetical protein